MMKRILLFLALLFTAPVALAAGGTCPSGANYISPTNPATGGGSGSVTLASLGITSCYFVSTSGLDTNNGTTESTPWLHAPGMPNCTNTCASATASSSIGVILEGGNIWHRSSGAVLMGGQWTTGAWGYVGIDPTWFFGGSFARPIVNLDNPLSTSTVASCSFDDGAASPINGVSVTAGVTFDGIEVTGACSSGTSNGGYLIMNGSNLIERVYCHGWTVTTTAGDDTYECFRGVSAGLSDRYLFDVADGQDSTFGTTCTTTSCVQNGGAFITNGATGWAFGDCLDVEYSVIRHVSNGMECSSVATIHDNLMEYQFEPSFGGRHGNVIEALGGAISPVCRIYNNIFRNLNNGVYVWPQCNTQYWFNDVLENISASGGANNLNCIMLSPQGSSNTGVVITVNLANITADQTCSAQAYGGNAGTPFWAAGSSVTFQNMHILGRTSIFSSSNFFTCSTGSTCTTETDAGGEIFQTTAVANGQGYTLTNDYQPTAVSNATVGNGTPPGNNLTSSCSTFSSDSALCSGTSNGVQEISQWGGEFASYPEVSVNARPNSAWNSGAYQLFLSTNSSLFGGTSKLGGSSSIH